VTKDETTIVDGGGDAERIAGRSTRSAPRSRRATRTTTARNSESAWPSWPWRGGDQGRCGYRGGAQGAQHRIEDAVRNAKAAVEEGVVAGGGVALTRPVRG